MNCYEHTLITKQDLQDDQAKTLIDKYQDIIKKNEGKVLKTEEWGLKNFSHKIKNNKKGFYFHIKLEGTGKTISELEKAENIDQMLIRFFRPSRSRVVINSVFVIRPGIVTHAHVPCEHPFSTIPDKGIVLHRRTVKRFGTH